MGTLPRLPPVTSLAAPRRNSPAEEIGAVEAFSFPFSRQIMANRAQQMPTLERLSNAQKHFGTIPQKMRSHEAACYFVAAGAFHARVLIIPEARLSL
jgi:hypothetical protein